MPDSTIHIGELSLILHRELRRGEEPLAIGGRGLAILSELAEARGALVSKDRLMAQVWPNAVVEDNALQAQVSQLRKIMGAEAGRLVAVHGRGYRLAIDAPTRPPASVAVLPFANLTGDPANAYLGDGVAEELLVILSRAKGLKVPARTSSFAYRGRDVDVRTIARDLGVEMVLEGSVRAAGERIRVTAQLIEAETGFHVWSENYDRRFGDLLALQDEIATTIAAALRAQLNVEQPRTPDFEAYHLYLRARALCEGQRQADMLIARDLLDRAIARDPRFARAHAQRGYCVYLGIMHGLFDSSCFSRVSADCTQALALDPRDSWIHALDGLVRASSCDWSGSRDAYSRSFAIGGSDPGEFASYGYFVLAPLGHSQAALQECRIARDAAPADPGVTIMWAYMQFILQQDFKGAVALLDHALSLGYPANEDLTGGYLRAVLALTKGEVERAVSAMALATPSGWRELGAIQVIEQTFLAMMFQGDRVSAAAGLKAFFYRGRGVDRLEQMPQLSAFTLSWLALLGALDEAYEVAGALVNSLSESGSLAPVILLGIWNPMMRPFREDPRFQDFARALNMFEYWERHGPPDGHALVDGRLVCL